MFNAAPKSVFGSSRDHAVSDSTRVVRLWVGRRLANAICQSSTVVELVFLGSTGVVGDRRASVGDISDVNLLETAAFSERTGTSLSGRIGPNSCIRAELLLVPPVTCGVEGATCVSITGEDLFEATPARLPKGIGS